MKPKLLFAILALTGCDDFATPAELSRPQILAIQSEPASLALNQSAELTILVADSEGPVEAPLVSWSILPQPGLPDEGTIVDDGATARYTAPGAVPSLPSLVTIEVTVEHQGSSLQALKGMLIGGPSLANPEINGLTVDGQEVTDEVILQRGQESALAVDAELSEDATYAWYARPGTIDAYRSTPTTIIAPEEEQDDGWLFVVVRDQGGVDYRAIPLRVE